MTIVNLSNLDVRLSPNGTIPKRAHATDAGLDLAASQLTELTKMHRVLLKTGVQVRIPTGYVGLLVPRSGLSKRNIILTNSCGVIDSDYRGELLVSLMYLGGSDGSVFIEAGERVAQLLVVPIALPAVNLVYEPDEVWENTARGSGGFGSTGTI